MKVFIVFICSILGMLSHLNAQESNQNSEAISTIEPSYLEVESILEKWDEYPFITGYTDGIPMQWGTSMDSMAFSRGLAVERFGLNPCDYKQLKRYSLAHNIIAPNIQGLNVAYQQHNYFSTSFAYRANIVGKKRIRVFGQIETYTFFVKPTESEAWLRLAGIDEAANNFGALFFYQEDPSTLQVGFDLVSNLYYSKKTEDHFFIGLKAIYLVPKLRERILLGLNDPKALLPLKGLIFPFRRLFFTTGFKF